jgi:hypothetical protein
MKGSDATPGFANSNLAVAAIGQGLQHLNCLDNQMRVKAAASTYELAGF